MHSPRDITLAVLAGGVGSRMGGPKAALQIRGETVLSYLMGRLNWPGPTMLVTAPGRTGPPGAQLFDVESVDPVEGQGPLRGILTAMENAKGDIIAITVDMPGITPAMLGKLIGAISVQPGLLGVMFRRAHDDENNIEPFPCIIRAPARIAISQMIQDGRRSVRGLLRDPAFATIDSPVEWPATVWTNLNTPADLAAFEKTLAGDDKM